MFKKLRNHQGQGVAVQYVLTFFLVIAVITGMSVYIQRALQARIRNAIRISPALIADKTDTEFVQGNLVGDIHVQYEPYYTHTSARKQVDSRETREHQPLMVGDTGVFVHDVNQTVAVDAVSRQAAPRDAPATNVSPEDWEDFDIDDYREGLGQP